MDLSFINSELINSAAVFSTVILSVIILIYSIKTYSLKHGERIRGSYKITKSTKCEDAYISSLTLENLKDRAVIIFQIYLQIGHEYFVIIEDREDDPLILLPFDVYKKSYDPIDLYRINFTRIMFGDALINNKVRRYIVLSTSKGKYIVKDSVKKWNPIITLYKNRAASLVHIERYQYKGKCYGGNVKYLVEIDGKEVIPI